MTAAPPTRPLPSRRAVLGTAGALAVTVPMAPAAAGRRRGRRSGGTPLLTGSGRLLVSRFSYGITPGLAREVKGRGGPTAWFEWQLVPDRIDDPTVAGLQDWWPGLAHQGRSAWDRQISGKEPGWILMANYQRWLLQRRVRTRRQVHEVMTEFWENHLHVPANGDSQFVYRKGYGDTIRAHALGRFDEMLQWATTHPAMLLFLDQAVSTKAHPNENLARELLELHTVGRGNHTEDDVKNVARILTGWAVDVRKSWAYGFDPDRHWTGPVRVLGFTHANGQAEGSAVTSALLHYLAHHPHTAARIARKLAVKFVSDDPPQSLVDRLAAAYLANGTAIKPVLKALVASPEFAASDGQKVRDPGEDVVATYRVLGVAMRRPTGERSAADAILWQAARIGALPMGWPRPDGQPMTSRAWASPSRMFASMQLHWSVGGGYYPDGDVTYRSDTSWVPRFPMRFDAVVDHLSRQLLHRPSTSELLAACCQATDIRARERITRRHPLITWKMNRVLSTILDSPAFYSR